MGVHSSHTFETIPWCRKKEPVSILPTGVSEVRLSRFSQLDDLLVIIRNIQTGKGIFTKGLVIRLGEMLDIGHPV